MENILEIKDLCKSYDDFSLKNVSFSLPKGYIMGFVGQNGSGKTTTIRSMLNMAKADNGKISIFGLDSVTDSIAITIWQTAPNLTSRSLPLPQWEFSAAMTFFTQDISAKQIWKKISPPMKTPSTNGAAFPKHLFG